MGELTENRQATGPTLQGLATDQFFYFFLRLRKSEIRRTVQTLRARYPDESPEQLSRRLIDSHSRVALLGGAFSYLPFMLPWVGQALRLAGVVGTTSMLTRMHLYLILEIALVHGHDIDDETRVPEMAAVVGATGLAAGTPLLVDALNWTPLLGLPVSMLSASAVTQLIGDSALRLYGGQLAIGDAAAPLIGPASTRSDRGGMERPRRGHSRR
jgi:hypothetical protein